MTLRLVTTYVQGVLPGRTHVNAAGPMGLSLWVHHSMGSQNIKNPWKCLVPNNIEIATMSNLVTLLKLK